MNVTRLLTGEASLVAHALDVLEASAGVQGKLVNSGKNHSDVAVLLKVGGRALQYECEVKGRVDRQSLLLGMINQTAPGNRLLVSSPLSLEMANRCRELNLQFIDTAGNAFISDGKGVYIYIAGRRSIDESANPTNKATVTPAALKMMFVFLAEPSLLNAAYRDISDQAMVSMGVIGKTLDMLEARHLIGTTAAGKRMIRSPKLFLDEWSAGYVSRLRPKLKKWRFKSSDLDNFRKRWNPGLRISAWGGEDGAALETKHLQAEESTIYINMREPTAIQDLVKDYRLSSDPGGEIEIVEMFWNADYFTEWFPTVPPHLIYADLLATHDSRNIAVAQQIAAKVIEHVQHQTRQTA